MIEPNPDDVERLAVWLARLQLTNVGPHDMVTQGRPYEVLTPDGPVWVVPKPEHTVPAWRRFERMATLLLQRGFDPGGLES